MREVAGIGPQTVTNSGWNGDADPITVRDLRICRERNPGFEETFAKAKIETEPGENAG
jgi:hypothetical protein